MYFFFPRNLWAFYCEDINKSTHTERFIRLHMPSQFQVCLKEKLTKNKIQSASKGLGDFPRLTNTTEAIWFL